MNDLNPLHPDTRRFYIIVLRLLIYIAAAVTAKRKLPGLERTIKEGMQLHKEVDYLGSSFEWD